MANTILTAKDLTREALTILHQKLNFVSRVNRAYDNRYEVGGAKSGDTVEIRLPNQYTVRTGATLSAQNTVEKKVDLVRATQKGVDLTFSSAELTHSIQDFSKRILNPAMSVLAADIEEDALSMYNAVSNQVGTPGSAFNTLKVALQGRQKLVENLAPKDGKWCNHLNPESNVDMVDALKGLYQDSNAIKEQYAEGMMGRTAGFDWYENSLMPRHTPGTLAGTPLVNGASQTGSSLITDGWTASTAALKEGDVFTIDGVYQVHPETKEAYSHLQQFVATADGTADGSGNLTISISPEIIVSGAYQTVDASPADNAGINTVGTGSTAYGINMCFQEEAFAFGTIDLVMPDGVDFSAREVLDGISMRIIRDYTISDDAFPCRIDVLYGHKAVRPSLACRIAN